MPWTTPTLRQVRELVRGEITGKLAGASFIGNSVLRVIADADAALAHLVLRYIDWLSKQFLPDTAETEWLDRHANIWITNADGTVGRKIGTYATGTVSFTGVPGTIVPAAAQLSSDEITYETMSQISIGSIPTEVDIRSLSLGEVGNLDIGVELSLVTSISGVQQVNVVSLIGGSDAETDDELRGRVLERIRNPPMGGDAEDYTVWAKSVAGVTRAWSYPLEMGIGTVTVRFMMDDLRSDNGGFPTQQDISSVTSYLNIKRPVAVKDFFVVSPIPQEIEFTITGLEDDDEATRAKIEISVREMLFDRAEPGQMIYRSWVDEAISQSVGEDHHTLIFDNTPMQSIGHMAVLGGIIYA